MIVYRLTSPSGKHYIGQTKNSINTRFKQHVQVWNRRKARGEHGRTTKLCTAFDKYHPDQWGGTVLFESDDQKQIDAYEVSLITFHDSIENGYNILPGGGLGRSGVKSSTEHKRKISEKRKAWFQTPDGLAWKEHLRTKGNICIGNALNKFKPGNNFGSMTAGKKRGPMPKGFGEAVSKRMKGHTFNRGKKRTPEQIESTRQTLLALHRHQSDRQKQAVHDAVAINWDITFTDGRSESRKGIKAWMPIPRSTLLWCIANNKGSKKWGIASVSSSRET
jgi:hypothetical protein